MARKNGNGEGSRPRERADGRWEARYWVGDKRRSVYGSTRKEAADKLARAITNSDEPDSTLAATDITVREFFAQYDDVVRDTMKRRSLETYRDIARLHLFPAFGDKKLRDLTREHVQRMYSQKRDAGLSAARVRRIHGALSSALNHAVRWGLVDNNAKGRWVSRSLDEEYLDRVRAYRHTEPYRKALRKRAVWVEPLFGEAKEWHGSRRFRLRGLEKVNAEALIIASGRTSSGS